jgi:hypothetical protein
MKNKKEEGMEKHFNDFSKYMTAMNRGDWDICQDIEEEYGCFGEMPITIATTITNYWKDSEV